MARACGSEPLWAIVRGTRVEVYRRLGPCLHYPRRDSVNELESLGPEPGCGASQHLACLLESSRKGRLEPSESDEREECSSVV